MLTIRTDLAVEAHALWRQKAGETAALSGVSAGESLCRGLPVTDVEILDEEGANVLGKPRGRYCTLDVSALWRREAEAPRRVVLAAAKLLGRLLPAGGAVLVAGRGQRAPAAHPGAEPDRRPPLPGGGGGGQGPPAPRQGGEGEEEGEDGQGQSGPEEEVGQVAHVHDLEKQGGGQSQAVAHPAGGHGGQPSRGGRTDLSTSPTGSPVSPASVRMRRWATVSRKNWETSSGRT